MASRDAGESLLLFEQGIRGRKMRSAVIAALCLTMRAAYANEINREHAVVRCSIATARVAALGVTARSDDGDGDTNLTLGVASKHPSHARTPVLACWSRGGSIQTNRQS
jgi:hypothetical protein